MAFKQKGFYAGEGTPKKFIGGGIKNVLNLRGKRPQMDPLGQSLAQTPGMPKKAPGINMGGKHYSSAMQSAPGKMTESSPNKFLAPVLRAASKILPAVVPAVVRTGSKASKPVAQIISKSGKVVKPGTISAANIVKAGGKGSKIKNVLKSAAKYTLGGYAMDKAIDWMFPGKTEEELTDAQKQKLQDAVDKGKTTEGGGSSKTTPKKDPYIEAAKKDPKLGTLVKQRDAAKKGSEEYNAAQNRINKAYGSKKRHGVTDTTATRGKTTVSRKRTPGIGESAKMVKDRTIGGRKQIDHAKSYITGKSKERKTKDSKTKERFYDAKGNLERKTKDKRGKTKDVIKSANTVTKVKINKRTGKVKTKTRKRALVGLGEFLGGKRSKGL
jgi:hypothetical protein